MRDDVVAAKIAPDQLDDLLAQRGGLSVIARGARPVRIDFDRENRCRRTAGSRRGDGLRRGVRKFLGGRR